jgi:hypothetical protein
MFLAASGLSHVVLRFFRLGAAWHYLVATFLVAFALDFGWRLWNLKDYRELFYVRTQVIEHGALTSAGLNLQLWETAELAALLAGILAIFWVIAIRPARVHV